MNYLIIDTESAWDEHLHEAYRVIEPGAEPHHRIASKRIFAAAALDISLTDEGILTINGIASWTERDHGSDGAIVEALFDHIRFRPDYQVVTWGGLAAEVPLLTLTALEHDLVLPPQFRAEQPFRRGVPRPHLDLGLAMKAKGRQWCHLSELGLRLGLPAELFAEKARVDFPSTQQEWEGVAAHVRLDVTLTAIVLLAWLRLQGHPGIRVPAAVAHVASWHLRNAAPSSGHQDQLELAFARMNERIASGYSQAA